MCTTDSPATAGDPQNQAQADEEEEVIEADVRYNPALLERPWPIADVRSLLATVATMTR